MTHNPNVLIVATTTRGWIAEELSHQTQIPVIRDFGLDAPLLPNSVHPAWWTHTEHATRLRAAGVYIPLTAPPGDWLAQLAALDRQLTGRDVWVGPADDLSDCPHRQGWCKPAQVKIPDVPARLCTVNEFGEALTAAHAPGGTLTQVTSHDMGWVTEFRTHILAGKPVAICAYLNQGETWDPTWPTHPQTDRAAAFAEIVAETATPFSPTSYTLDVGVDAAGRWTVVESNPVWSSAFYGAPPEPVVTTITEAVIPGPCPWDPDPWLVEYARRKRPLKLCSPVWVTQLQEHGAANRRSESLISSQ